MFLKLYAIALPMFLAFDALWLGVISKNFYKSQISFLMKSDVNWTAAVLFYLLFIVGLVQFVISPAVQKGSLIYAVLYGALFGLVTYATYDLTNLATVKDWPILVTVVDLVWGMAISVGVSVITYFIIHKLG